jgi:hypothetical protein
MISHPYSWPPAASCCLLQAPDAEPFLPYDYQPLGARQRPTRVSQVVEGLIYLGALPERWRGCIASRDALLALLCDLKQNRNPKCPWNMEREIKPMMMCVAGLSTVQVGSKARLRTALEGLLQA